LAKDYIVAAEIRAALPDAEWGSTYDVLLSQLANAASRAIDRYTGRAPGAYYADVPSVRYIDGSGTPRLWIGELAAAPAQVWVAESGDGSSYVPWDDTEYICWPYDALERGEPYLRLDIDLLNGTKGIWYAYPRAVKISGQWGYSAYPPADVKQACLIQAIRWFKRSQQAYRDIGGIVDLGQLQYVQALDPEVAQLLSHLRRQVI